MKGVFDKVTLLELELDARANPRFATLYLQ